MDRVADEPQAELAAIQAELALGERGFNSTRRILKRKDEEICSIPAFERKGEWI